MNSSTGPIFPPEVEMLSPQEQLFRKRAGIGVRYRALMIDMTLASVGGFVFALLFFKPFQSYYQKSLAESADQEMIQMMGGLTQFYGLLFAMTVGILLFLIAIACFEGAWGTSPGKHFLKIRILDESGRPAEKSSLILRAVVKNLGTLLSILAIPTRSMFIAVFSTIVCLVVGLGYVMAFGKRRQTLHDHVAETAVYPVISNFEAAEILSQTPSIPPPETLLSETDQAPVRAPTSRDGDECLPSRSS